MRAGDAEAIAEAREIREELEVFERPFRREIEGLPTTTNLRIDALDGISAYFLAFSGAEHLMAALDIIDGRTLLETNWK